MEKEMQIRPLGRLLNLIESLGFSVEYHYDDLVFINNTAFIFQFDSEDAELILLRFNTDCKRDVKDDLTKTLMEKSKEEEVKLVLAADFSIEQVEGKEEFQIKFMG